MAIRRHRRPTTLAIGTISSGTLRLEDLIPALLNELEALRLTRAERGTVRQIRRCVDQEGYFDGAMVETGSLGQPADADPDDDYAELTTIADNHCPDYCYVGSLEGDGAALGCWPIVPESTDEDVFRSVYYPTDRVATTDRPYWLHVNDHGNATLYRRAGRRWLECWSVV